MTAVQAGAMAAGGAVHASSSPHADEHATHQALLHTVCTHCGQAVPAGLLRAEASEQFCCHGCEAAYAIIHSCGLEQYYQLLEETGDVASKQRDEGSGRSRAYGEFDDPVFRELFCQRLGESQVRTEFLLGGVHCGACLWLLERLPRVRAGVLEARLDLRRSALTVTIDERATSLSEVARVLAKLGYPPHPSRGKGVRDVRRREDRAMMVRMAVAGACAGNIMLLYFALYAGLFQGIEHAHEQLLRYTAMILNTLCLAWPANTFLRSAWAAIRTRTVHVDVPIVLGLYLGGIWGIWKTFAGAGDLYFDSISALVFFLLVGRFLQQRQNRSASDAIELLFSLAPLSARKREGDALREVSVESLRVHDIVVVRAGECFPADGVIIEGQTSADQAILTGESRAVPLGVGDEALAGATNLSSEVAVRVVATGTQTRAGQLMKLVSDAAQQRAPVVLLADRWGHWLLYALLTLATITLGIWWHKGPAVAIDHAAALLIATCPCGLGLATPLAMTIALGRAARRGLLVKGGAALQVLGAARHKGVLILDKTGTITTGKLSVVEVLGDPQLAVLAAAAEAGCSHPAATAIARDLARDLGADASQCEASEHVQGMGVRGIVAGKRVVLGNEAMLAREGVHLQRELAGAARLRAGRSGGLSSVHVAVDGAHVATLLLGDPVRPDAPRAIAALREAGWRVRVLSGDSQDVVESVGRAVGIEASDCMGGALPAQKLEQVRHELASLQGGAVVMVGDGVNDSAALAAASVGIAVRGGAEASLAAADVSLAREGLLPIVELMDGARGTMRAIHATIAASLFYNVIAAGLSMAGAISPLLAAIIMPASSLTVLGIAWGSRAFGTKERGR